MSASIFRKLFGSSPRTKSKPLRRPSRLALESLEVRDVPAMIFVTGNVTDSVSYTDPSRFQDGPVTPLVSIGNDTYLAKNLRSAVADHNDFAGASTIVLDTAEAFQLNADVLAIDYTTADALTIKSNGGSLATIDAQLTSSSIIVNGGGTTTLDHLQITHVSGAPWGSIDNEGTLFLTDSSVNENYNIGSAGIFNMGTATVTRSTISNNNAEGSDGGGIVNVGTLALVDSTISGNTAFHMGGGVLNRGNMTMTNCTVTGNHAIDYAYGTGGGLFNNGPAVLNNNIITGNDSHNLSHDPVADIGSWGGIDVANSFNNIIGTGLGGLVSGVNGNRDGIDVAAVIDTNLAFNSGPTMTYALIAGSPAIDAGKNAVVPASLTTDQRGLSRISGAAVDIGAVEVQVPTNHAPTITAPAAITAFEDVDQKIAGLSVGDQDGDSLTVKLMVGHGTLTLGSTAGLTVAGSGSGVVTLSGSAANLNAAIAGLTYRSSINYSGDDWMNVTVGDGSLSTTGSIAIHIQSIAAQAADLQARVAALRSAGVLSKGQANSLIALIDTKDNNSGGKLQKDLTTIVDVVKLEAFLIDVALLQKVGVLSKAQADMLSGEAMTLLTSVTRR